MSRSDRNRDAARSGHPRSRAQRLRAGSPGEITLEIRDFATMPMTGKVDGKGQVMGLLARVNFMREEPGRGAKSLVFVNDLNGPLYIFDKATGKFTTYLDFNGRDGRPGLFHRLPTEGGSPTVLSASRSIPITRATASFTLSIWKIRSSLARRCRTTRIFRASTPTGYYD